ncbi:hypothetical protein UFOVP1290_323 [uncultured Caudovirales phage]|uniref:Uncharacterized protein n=1 Tax=uncultured Caudovirales phage TaxID=2100421 RepID=A0A6J5RHF3_9CAUD|nr:hypothetical protein UFOVP1290_323 [uncultured Caudovirales phage]
MANKINLKLLKKLVSQLEDTLDKADKIKESEGDVVEYVVDLSMATGLAGGIMSEAGMLIGDIQSHILSLQSPAAIKSMANQADLLDKLFAPNKGGNDRGSGSSN